MDNRSANQTDVLNRVIRTVILIIVSLLLSILSVSFAVHHMRLQFETEFRNTTDNKLSSICDVVGMTLDGDEIAADPSNAAVKYNDVLALMLADTTTESYTTESYALFLYTEGRLSVLMSHGPEAPESFEVASRDISDWLNIDNNPTTVGTSTTESILVPIADSTGRCVAVFEYKCSFNNLKQMGDNFESKILTSVIITVACGIVVYIIQLLVPKFINAGKRGQRL
ncbi:MAG: hypothetical protein MJ094_03840 [Saccharofermentans sp.]|nr:hypothetical protein [Saccharofermentans sp.]